MKKTEQGLSTVDIKGKDYVMVNSRVQYFRENFNDYTLQTTWLKLDENIAICKAIVKDPNGRIYSTGTAYETAGSTYINKTSFIENCETSAVGRALGFCNIGISVSIATAEEVGNAIGQQSPSKTVSFPQSDSKPPKEPKKPVKATPSVFKVANKPCSRDKYIKTLVFHADKAGIEMKTVKTLAKIDNEIEKMTDAEVLKMGATLASAIKSLNEEE